MNKLVFSAFLSLALATFAAESPANSVFNVRDFGAKGDGVTFDTLAIQRALDTCGKTGPGTVKFSRGTYLSKPLNIRNSNTTILLEEGATLLASPSTSDFLKRGGDWLKAKSGGDFIPFLSGSDANNITITGQGTIDGNGKIWWPEAEKARQKTEGYTLPRPNLFVLTRCKNVRVSGIHLVNSPKFHFVPTECADVNIDGVTIFSPEGAANTDGIDPSNCQRVKITHCTIDVGDDNIAIKSSRRVEGREFGCEDIEVTDCTFKHGHGVSIGSETVGGVRNVTVRRCTFEDTDNGLRIKSRRERGGLVENVTYSDITMSNVHPAISIVAYYQATTHAKYPKDDKPQPITPATPIFRNIHVTNVTGNSTADAGLIVGLPESPVQDVVLENVRLSAEAGLTIAHAKGIRLNNSQVIVAKGQPIILDDALVEGVASAK